MEHELAPGWQMELDRGPDCIFVRLESTAQVDQGDLVEALCRLLEQEFRHRLVLELDRMQTLRSRFLADLLRLQQRVCDQGGMLRICGLSETAWETLRRSNLYRRLPAYRDREEAIMGYRPSQPR